MAPSCFAFISEFSMNFSRGLLTVGLHLIGELLVYTFNFNGILLLMESGEAGLEARTTEMVN